MNYEQFKKMRAMTASFIAATVAMAVVANNIVLALAGVVIGVLFLVLVRKTVKAVLVDERIINMNGQAAKITYTITTVTLAFLSLVFVMIGRKATPPQTSIESLGITFSYIALLNLALYSISYKYLSNKYGESDDEQN